MGKTVSHICILVRDIDKAIEDYTKIFGVVAPQLLEREVLKQERFAGKDKYITAFFGAVGDACDIQLLQAPDQDSSLYQRLEKVGEGVHHIAFSSEHLEDTYQQFCSKGVSVNDEIISEHHADDDMTDVRHFWVLPKYSHGVLIEIIDQYDVIDGMLKKAD